MKLRKGYILVGISVLLLAYQPALNDSLLEKIPLTILAYLRIVVATLCLMIIKITTKKEEKEIHKPTLIKESLILGFILSISTIFFCLGVEKNQMTEFMNNGMLPIFIIMMTSMLFKEERNTMFNLVGSVVVVLAIVGVYLIISNDFSISTSYDYHLIYVTIGALIWAAYLTYYRKQEENLNIKDTFLIIGIFLTIFYTIILLNTKELAIIKTIDNTSIFTILLLALIVDVGFVFTFYKGVEIIGCNKASIVLMLSPALSTITLAMILNKEVLKIQWIGCGLILLANIVLVSKDLIDEEENEFYY